ncbi:FAD-dependent oxidoreductase [Kitasatospora sp. GP82]|uniref:flavin monoamine oxidase family protein n=1 Tax=Kitasatospora sp. GP82 TaxID=3035089 RepID=UPI002476ACBB|nr:FAD-dependent oxidoreductase [Kitasatospora sp. GP82]MDH6125851.1 monoamine oxidase [Kitasatospora sp. GP82]
MTQARRGTLGSARGRSGFSRRGFLRAVGISGGASTMFAAMGALELAPTAEAAAAPPYRAPRASDFRLTGRSAASVVVLGGGVAGLVSAYELGKAGYDCTILEPRGRTGGRNFTARAGTRQSELHGYSQTARFAEGQYMNCGAARLAQWMVTVDYCRELGVPIEVFTNYNADAYIYNEKSGMTPGRPVRYRTAEADTYGYVGELLAKASDQGALDKQLTAADRERLLAFLERWGRIGAKADGFAYRGSTRRGFGVWPGAAGTPGIELSPVPSVSEVFASGVGRYFSFNLNYNQAMVMFQPVGGMDQLPKALTRAIGPRRVRLGCQATSVTELAHGVRVAYQDGTGQERVVDADYCIAAMPPHLLAGLPHNLGSAVQRALTSIAPASAGKIGLEYRSRWWETDHRIYGGITETDLDLSHIWHPSYDFNGERGVMIGYYNTGSRADRYGTMSPKAREERAVALGSRIYGRKYRTELASSFSVSWQYVPHLEGAWHRLPGGSPDAPVLRPLTEPSGRVLFAGDWLSYTDGWQHGAILSARKAVTALHARALKHEHRSTPAERGAVHGSADQDGGE